MSQTKASVTSLMAAYARAHHTRRASPRIFEDPLAEKLYDPQEVAPMERDPLKAVAFFDPEFASTLPEPQAALDRVMEVQLAPITVSRARWSEDLLEQALGQGVGQYVVLVAGLDTFAWRRPELLARLQVFEVDHPVTQADKRRRVAAAGWAVPDRLHFAAVDLAREPMAEALRGVGFDPAVPAFFSWLGVTYYLAREAVWGTLGALARLAAPGSLVAFDHLDGAALAPDLPPGRVQRMLFAARMAGEPMQGWLEPAELTPALARAGLSQREHLGPEQIQARYFAGRTDAYRAFEHVHFTAAEVR
jgi:methyltransferase (TIGR00027 family)